MAAAAALRRRVHAVHVRARQSGAGADERARRMPRDAALRARACIRRRTRRRRIRRPIRRRRIRRPIRRRRIRRRGRRRRSNSRLGEPLAVLARGVEADLRPALHRHLQVVLVGREEHRVAVDVGRERGRLLALEVAARVLVGKREPARGRDVGGVVDRVDLVLGREPMRDDLELQRADGAQQQRVRRASTRTPGSRLPRPARCRPFASGFALNGSRGRATRKSSGAKYGMPLKSSASPSVSVSPIDSWPWLWMPMMSPATASSLATRSLAMNVSALRELHLAAAAQVAHLHRRRGSGPSRRGRTRSGRGASGPCSPGS